MSMAMDVHAAVEELLEAVFSMQSVLRLYNYSLRVKSERMLHKDYDCKGSVAKKKVTGHEP
jgi:hypothetical protein